MLNSSCHFHKVQAKQNMIQGITLCLTVTAEEQTWWSEREKLEAGQTDKKGSELNAIPNSVVVIWLGTRVRFIFLMKSLNCSLEVEASSYSFCVWNVLCSPVSSWSDPPTARTDFKAAVWSLWDQRQPFEMRQSLRINSLFCILLLTVLPGYYKTI